MNESLELMSDTSAPLPDSPVFSLDWAEEHPRRALRADSIFSFTRQGDTIVIEFTVVPYDAH
jgi:hypothetical protein